MVRIFLITSFYFLLRISTSCTSPNPRDVREVAPQKSIEQIGDTIYGRAIHIVDGDTYDLLHGDKIKTRIRMYGIDAPERSQDFYKASKKHLGSLLKGKQLMVILHGGAGWKRMAGETYIDGFSIELEMIKAGFAWYYSKYSTNDNFAAAERIAKFEKRGLWSTSNPVEPWVFRSHK